MTTANIEIILDKNTLEEKLAVASRFTMTKISAISSLQDGLFQIKNNELRITTTNLKDLFTTTIKVNTKQETEGTVDIKKITEFLSLLAPGEISLNFEGNNLEIRKKKTKGVFGIPQVKDFPQMPVIKGKKSTIRQDILEEVLPFVLFAASINESKPILSGINFSVVDKKLYIVATDGFRLSLVARDLVDGLSNIIISSSVLREVLRLSRGKKEVGFIISQDQKSTQFIIGDINIYTKVIEGEFPPFERVIPKTHTTKAIIDREDFLRNIKTAAVFARESSNIIVLKFKNDGLYIRPKNNINSGTEVYQEANIEGDLSTIAFNYKFLTDVLGVMDSEQIVFEMTSANAPGVFRKQKEKNQLHVIMPVRTDESE